MINPKKIIAKYFTKEEMELYMVHLTNYIDMIIDDTKTMYGMLPSDSPLK